MSLNQLIASAVAQKVGPVEDLELAWTTGFLEAMQGDKTPVDGFSMHFIARNHASAGRARL